MTSLFVDWKVSETLFVLSVPPPLFGGACTNAIFLVHNTVHARFCHRLALQNLVIVEILLVH